ncbi:unnamed protein product [Nippostrongylus brasiliensis]|uniref:Nitroreductase domain-containing protein n=1 Tax=Nippostrongylus brasiliensis TaxID=27835 RepID=A0A0N4Y193_NIPBR|nr:unnamed protein product [Nippostrongylus brasiliensis]
MSSSLLHSSLNLEPSSVIALQDIRYQGAVLDRIHKRSTFDPRKVERLVQDAKTNNKDAIRILGTLHSYETIKSDLETANKDLDHVNATYAKPVLIIELRNALWYNTHGLRELLSAYEISPEGLIKDELLTAVYYASFACIDLVTALLEVLSDPTLKDLTEKVHSLGQKLNSAPFGSEVPENVAELAGVLLMKTGSQSGEH